MAKKMFFKKIQKVGTSSGLLLTKEILGEDLFAPIGEELKIIRDTDHIKIYPLKRSSRKTKEVKEVKE